LLGGQVSDKIVNGVEFLNACDIKAAAQFVKSFDNCRIAIHLHCIVNLNPGEVLSKQFVILDEFLVIHDEKWSAMGFRKFEKGFLIHG
jgi:hypothetical protein